MRQLIKTNEPRRQPATRNWVPKAAPDMSRLCELTEANLGETLEFLAIRPVHTLVMTSFIHDNGIVSDLNRGKFYGYRDPQGTLDGVALIGHSTLFEARTEAALEAFAILAKSSETPIHLIMSSGDAADRFWNAYSSGFSEPKLRCEELLFEAAFPFAVQENEWELKNAGQSHLLQVAKAQAEVALVECGVDPLVRDCEGFLERVARRIEKNRVFIATDGDELVFKADIIAETNDVIYLEGVYVNPNYRGQGVGPRCLATLTVNQLNRVSNICLLSNVDFTHAHRSFEKAGYKVTDKCVTLFV